MPAASLGSYKLIRNLWPTKAIAELLYKNSPLLGLMPKDTNFGEKIRYISVGTGGPQGLSAAFSDAKQYKTASTAEEFAVQLRSYYGNFSIGGDIWRRYEFTGNKALLVDPMVRDSKNILTEAKNDFSSFLHGNGGGAIGRITSGSSTSSATITLDAGADIRRIRRGMTIQTASTDGSSGTVNVGTGTVSAIGGTPSAPTVTISEASWIAAMPGIGSQAYIFRAGTFGAVMYGVDAWCPSHTGSPGTFLGVTRNNDPDKLAGMCLSATTSSPRQRIMDAARMLADGPGADRPVYLQSTRNWVNLYNELASANALVQTKAPSAKIGSISTGVDYDAIKLVTPVGSVEVVADPWMPDNVERLMDLSVWKLSSCGELLHWDRGATPDSPMLEDAQDSREVRLVGDVATECWNPWANVRVAVTA
jgi:hypothetical protein